MKIIIATGGSGGHIFPALEVAKKLKTEKHDVFFVGVSGHYKKNITDLGFDVTELNVQGVRTLTACLSMVRAVFQSMGILRKYRPAVVCGFGGYGAFAAVAAAVCLRYPTLIHEQNVIPGRANRFLAKFVSKIALSFPQTREYFSTKKTVVTGCPCHYKRSRDEKAALYKKFHLDEKKWTILVMGGSQGSHRINDVFVQTAERLKSEMDFQVIHLTGHKDSSTVKEAYQRLGITSFVCAFFDPIEDIYTLTDLAVSRAGAVTTFELAIFGIPAVLIPYPFAGRHQNANARALAETKPARILQEKDLTPERLGKEILQLYSRENIFSDDLAVGQELWFNDADKRLAGEITELL